jgi:hypothetical protein
METSVELKYDMRLNRLLYSDMEYDVFRSEICHMYHNEGDYNFIKKVMKSDLVGTLWKKQQKARSLYVLSMIDYISWKNDVPFFEGYAKIRAYKLDNPLYPPEVIMLDKIEHSDKNRRQAVEYCKQDECGVFFYRHNIIEGSIENVI